MIILKTNQIENFLPFIIMIFIYVGYTYLKKLNSFYSIVLLGCALITLLVSTFLTGEKVYFSLLMSLVGLIFLIKKIKERSSNLNKEKL
jgi:hypothetical protein